MSQLYSFWPLLIIILIVGIIVFLLHTPITFTIRYTQTNSHTHIRVGAQALNKLINIGLRSLYQTKTNTNNDDNLIEEDSKINPITSLPTMSEVLHIFKRIRKKHLNRLKCDFLKWDTQVGVNDPMGSALISGSLWAVKYYILGLISRKVVYSQKPQISIQPLYNHIHFNTEVHFVLKLKIRQALFIGIITVWHLTKSRRKKRKIERKLANLA